jgi:hypothetical protein
VAADAENSTVVRELEAAASEDEESGRQMAGSKLEREAVTT